MEVAHLSTLLVAAVATMNSDKRGRQIDTSATPSDAILVHINPTTAPQASERATFYEVGDSTERDEESPALGDIGSTVVGSLVGGCTSKHPRTGTDNDLAEL